MIGVSSSDIYGLINFGEACREFFGEWWVVISFIYISIIAKMVVIGPVGAFLHSAGDAGLLYYKNSFKLLLVMVVIFWTLLISIGGEAYLIVLGYVFVFAAHKSSMMYRLRKVLI